MASKRLNDIAHDFITKLGRDTEAMYTKMESLPKLTDDERKDITSLKNELDEFYANLDEAHEW